MAERIALDTRYWNSPEQGIENTASFMVEQKDGALEDRINYTELFLDDENDLFHPVFGKLKNTLEIKSATDELEAKAIDKLNDWAKTNDEGHAIWISPPYPDQKESRFIVYDMQRNEGRKKISLHAVCGNQNLSDCLTIAEQINAYSNQTDSKIISESHLRETPITFSPEPYFPSWIDLLQNLIEPPQIWEKIRQGVHIEEKNKLIELAAKELAQLFSELQSAESDRLHVVLGAKLEQRFINQGFKILHKGPCGISNVLALASFETEGGSINSPFNLIYNVLPALDKSFPCPSCEKPIPSGKGITKCPHCGITKEQVGSNCD